MTAIVIVSIHRDNVYGDGHYGAASDCEHSLGSFDVYRTVPSGH